MSQNLPILGIAYISQDALYFLINKGYWCIFKPRIDLLNTIFNQRVASSNLAWLTRQSSGSGLIPDPFQFGRKNDRDFDYLCSKNFMLINFPRLIACYVIPCRCIAIRPAITSR
jgi:hypothetical protein